MNDLKLAFVFLGDANSILKYITLGLQLVGVRQVVRNRLQDLLILSLNLSEKFSVYFVGFIVCNLIILGF